MPFQQFRSYSPAPTKIFEIPRPGMGGLNLKDLEYEQEPNQTPYLLNMMYRNGSFGKRYGQVKAFEEDFTDDIYATVFFNGVIHVHVGTTMYAVNPKTKVKTQETYFTGTHALSETKGLFIKFAQTLYYYNNSVIYEYKYENNAWAWGIMEPYIPDTLINCSPTGSVEEGIPDFEYQDQINLLTLQFNEVYNGTADEKNYKAWGDDEDMIDWDVRPTVKVDDVVTDDFTVDKANKKIVFTTAPGEGQLNVVITYTLKQSWLAQDRDRLLASKYYINYGSNGSSHLFLAGGGASKYFYSESYDASYFPENNWEILGSTEQDIVGFGLQYNVLLVLKPKEVFSIYSYQITASMVKAEDEDQIGGEAFNSTIVNSQIGCDCPYSIQLINNQLTWFNSVEGVCTLVSTNIADERNVRVISRNIEKTNNMGIKGILDYTEDLNTIQSIDFDNRYFLVFPDSGMCFMWDYETSPFAYSSSKVTDPRTLNWFLFDKFYVGEFLKADKELFYISSKDEWNKNFIQLNYTFEDLDFNGDGQPDGINAYYMTPFLQFNAVEYLKTVKNIWVQCRGDTASIIDMYYYTDENLTPEQDPESIRIGGKIWSHFSWDNFEWLVVNWANTFRRKCSLKKIQMVAFYFENVDKYDGETLIESVAGRDMSITHIGMDYQIVKTVK